MDPNSHEALLRRREAGTLKWRGPALMLFARTAFGVGAQAIVAAVFVLRASPTPWHDAEPWLPVYGTLIDAGCLTLLWRLTRREASACSILSASSGHDSSAMHCWALRSSLWPSYSYSV